MRGYNKGKMVWDRFPWGKQGRAARVVWYSVKHQTGTPPTIVEYHPAMRWSEEVNGERVWHQRAQWVIHHKEAIYRFRGASKLVAEEIETNGLGEPEEVSVSEYEVTDGYEDCEVCSKTCCIKDEPLHDVQAGRICSECHHANTYDVEVKA